jgi:polysaccharide export outer membrane protein
MSRLPAALLMPALLLSGCATMQTPRNAPGSLYAAQQGVPGHPACLTRSALPDLAGWTEVSPASFALAPDMLAAGDRLRLTIAGDKGLLTGSYVIAADGHIQLAGGLRIGAAGFTLAEVERSVRTRLVAERLIRPLSNGVRLEQVELAGVPVSVAGAVFEGGTVRVGERQAEVRNLNLSNIVSGDLNASRTVSTALRAAGGIRPDANPSAIYLIRGGHYARLDLSGALAGFAADDVPVTAGDRIVVSSTGCLKDALVRPSQITPPGIRIFISNLSRPAPSNAMSAIGKDSTSLPYGTRFSQALVTANCVGGSAMNAGRSAVLMSRNPVTGQSVVISRPVEQLVRAANRDAMDPWLMPGDAIACYDSAAMNLRDVVSVISETVTPAVLLKNMGQ